MSAANYGSDSQEIFEGESVTEEDSIWLEFLVARAKESVNLIEEAAKQIISLTTVSQGLYFAAISFGELKKSLVVMPLAQQLPIVLALSTPILLWLISLHFATRVFIPRYYGMNFNSPDVARATYNDIVDFKKRQLNQAHSMLVLGFILLLINVVGYLLYFPLAPALSS